MTFPQPGEANGTISDTLLRHLFKKAAWLGGDHLAGRDFTSSPVGYGRPLYGFSMIFRRSAARQPMHSQRRERSRPFLGKRGNSCQVPAPRLASSPSRLRRQGAIGPTSHSSIQRKIDAPPKPRLA